MVKRRTRTIDNLREAARKYFDDGRLLSSDFEIVGQILVALEGSDEVIPARTFYDNLCGISKSNRHYTGSTRNRRAIRRILGLTERLLDD